MSRHQASRSTSSCGPVAPGGGGWPVWCREVLSIGDIDAGVGICTLWTPCEHFTQALDPRSYAVVGNLYSRAGIGLLIRNVLARPSLRHLVLCGVDLTGTGADLALLLTEDQKRHPLWRALVEDGLPVRALEAFRRRVVLYDLRGERHPNWVARLLGAFPALAPRGRPLFYRRVVPEIDTFPAEPSGFVFRAPTVASVWLQAVAAVLRFGAVTPTEWGSRQRELLNVQLVVKAERSASPQLPSWVGVSSEQLDAYAASLIDNVEPLPGSYSYGQRLRTNGGRDQLAAAIENLRRFGDSRRAVAVLWDPVHDADSPQPPCITTIQFRVRDGQLHLTAHLRSSDLFRAWPLNALGLCRLQSHVAKELGAAPGTLTTISVSAHIYEDSWAEAAQLVRDTRSSLPAARRSERDPRGSFAIRLEPPEIVIEHYSPAGQLLAMHSGGSAPELERHIEPFVSLPAHALYLGRQLALAETALHRGEPYVQDSRNPSTAKGGKKQWHEQLS